MAEHDDEDWNDLNAALTNGGRAAWEYLRQHATDEELREVTLRLTRELLVAQSDVAMRAGISSMPPEQRAAFSDQMGELAGDKRAELDARFERAQRKVIDAIDPDSLPPMETEEQILEYAVQVSKTRQADAMRRLLDEPMRVGVPEHLRCPPQLQSVPSELLSRGAQWGADAELVVCWPPGEPLLWWSLRRVSGAVCVYGTRLPAATPLRAFAEGEGLAEIEASWPSATPEIMRRLVNLWAHLLNHASGGEPT